MTTGEKITVGILEAVALIVIVRLWVSPKKTGVAIRIIWSLVLLVPLLGIVLYGFVRSDPDAHPYDTDTTSSDAAADLSNGSHGHD